MALNFENFWKFVHTGCTFWIFMWWESMMLLLTIWGATWVWGLCYSHGWKPCRTHFTHRSCSSVLIGKFSDSWNFPICILNFGTLNLDIKLRLTVSVNLINTLLIEMKVFQVITLHRIVSLFWHMEEPDLISMKMEAAWPSKTVEQTSDPAVL